MMPQVVITASSGLLLGSRGIDGASVIVFESGRVGSTARMLKAAGMTELKSGASGGDPA